MVSRDLSLRSNPRGQHSTSFEEYSGTEVWQETQQGRVGEGKGQVEKEGKEGVRHKPDQSECLKKQRYRSG